MSRQDRKLDAAEYVIGTLSPVERKAFQASLETDAETRSDVQFWERSFGALNASIAPEIPPESVWDKIEASLEGGQSDPAMSESGASTASNLGAPSSVAQSIPFAANDNAVEKLRRSLGRWRFGAMAASVAAVLLGAYVANQQYGFAPNAPGGTPVAKLEDGKEYIAVVNANGDQPSLVINIDAKTGNVTVRSVGVERPEGKSLELWYVPEGQKAISVGLVGEGGIDLKDLTAKSGDLLAISLEPQGGSPTGTATGPVIYTGKLIENIDAQPK